MFDSLRETFSKNRNSNPNNGWFEYLKDFYKNIYRELYVNVNEKKLNTYEKVFYRTLLLNNIKTRDEILDFVPLCAACKIERVMFVRVDVPFLTCDDAICKKEGKFIASKLKTQEVAKEYEKKSLLEICNELDMSAKRTPFGWFEAIKLRYAPFIKELFPVELEYGREVMLYKFWSLNKITTIEEARQTLKMCKYCRSNVTLPRSNIPEMSEACHQERCQKAYVYECTSLSVKEKYGVDNVNQLDFIKKLKSEKLVEANRINKDGIVDLRIMSCQEKYGVDNVSQCREIKSKKAETFEKNYGVSNIFKRSDLMKDFWMSTLGADNPKHISNINIKRVEKCLDVLVNKNENSFVHNDKFFGVLSIYEKIILKEMLKNLDYRIIESNNKIFEQVINNVSRIYVPDIVINDEYYFEIKSGFEFLSTSYMDFCEQFMKNKNFYYILYKNPDEMALMSKTDRGYSMHFKGRELLKQFVKLEIGCIDTIRADDDFLDELILEIKNKTSPISI